jgi:formylglycine-generating enzyme required for sulfatase activity
MTAQLAKNGTEMKTPWLKLFILNISKIASLMAFFAILGWVIISGFINNTTENKPNLVQSNNLAGTGQTPLITEPEMVIIPAGNFQMGKNKEDDDEKPVHSVNVKSFKLGRYEVTFDEYDEFAKATNRPKPNQYVWTRGKRPVINVSWRDASAFAAWLSQKTGKRYRLPTEAEWEYAARAGTAGNYYWGSSDLRDFTWFSQNSADETHLVGQKQPNAFGLYDVSGNVWEWVQDCWHDNYQNAPDDGSAWEWQNNGDCDLRVLRGGSWNDGLWNVESSARDGWFPAGSSNSIGFRLAQDFP